MSRWFPKVRRVTVKQAGHWVHSEEPEIVIEALQRFLAPAPAK
jgi:pimeloyl-ACP methyl ester carboxylesterase